MSEGGSATNVLPDVARQEGGVPLMVLRVANSIEGARGGPNSSIYGREEDLLRMVSF